MLETARYPDNQVPRNTGCQIKPVVFYIESRVSMYFSRTTVRQAGSQVARQAGSQVVRQAGSQVVREAGSQIVRPAGSQVVRQAGTAM